MSAPTEPTVAAPVEAKPEEAVAPPAEAPVAEEVAVSFSFFVLLTMIRTVAQEAPKEHAKLPEVGGHAISLNVCFIFARFSAGDPSC